MDSGAASRESSHHAVFSRPKVMMVVDLGAPRSQKVAEFHCELGPLTAWQPSRIILHQACYWSEAWINSPIS